MPGFPSLKKSGPHIDRVAKLAAAEPRDALLAKTEAAEAAEEAETIGLLSDTARRERIFKMKPADRERVFGTSNVLEIIAKLNR